jgi:hypothetical protein
MRTCRGCVAGLFGVCGTDYCAPEREGLIEEAVRRSEQRGHTLTPFRQVKGRPVWDAECTRCGLSATICLNPAPGEPDIYGDAITQDCPSAE